MAQWITRLTTDQKIHKCNVENFMLNSLSSFFCDFFRSTNTSRG